tara:strand:- start:374 stop:553 length:180 start_codon:yes stop_codon:yes gene_type:complete
MKQKYLQHMLRLIYYLTNSVGIGEHPQHLIEVDKQLDKIAQAEEKLDALDSFRKPAEEK